MNKRNPFSGKIMIPVTEWRSVHPKDLTCRTDVYYAHLASSIAGKIQHIMSRVGNFDADDYKHLAVDVCAYLEDKVSGLNCWNAFMSLYRSKYGNDYPFFNTEGEEMYDDEPNYSDIKFLVWRALNWKNDDYFLDPDSEVVWKVADAIFQDVEKGYEEAPENAQLREWIYDAGKYDDPLRFREVCEWIVSNSYLFVSMEIEDNFKQIYSVMANFYGGKLPQEVLLYAIRCYFTMGITTGPMNLYPWEWLSAMMALSPDGECRRLSDSLREVRSLSLAPYAVLEAGEESALLRSITGEEMRLSYRMLKHEGIADVKSKKKIYVPLFLYNGMWQVNGLCSALDVTSSVDEEHKKYEERKEKERIGYDTMLEKNGGARMGVAKDFAEIKTHFGFDNVPDRSEEKVMRKAKDSRNILYFINKNGQLAMLNDAAEVVALPGNPYYDRLSAAENGSQLILGDAINADMRLYLIEHNLIPDAQLVDYDTDDDATFEPDEKSREWFQKNMAFLNDVCHTDIVHFDI